MADRLPPTTDTDAIICPCFNISRGRIQKILASGHARDLNDIRILSRAGAGCGGCEFDVEELIASEFVERKTGRLSKRQEALRRVLIANRRMIASQRVLLRAIRSTFRPRPAFYGTWWVERPDLHARINLCNVASPAAPSRVWKEAITIELFGADGRPVAARNLDLAPYASRTFEVRDLLPAGLAPGHGLLRVKYHNRRSQGAKRFYMHLYNDRGLTFVHEKFSGYQKGPEGYWTLVGVPSSSRLDVHLIVANGTANPLAGAVVLTNRHGQTRECGAVRLPPLGTAVVRLRDAAPDLTSWLGGETGTAQFTFRRGVMTYYLVHDLEADTWQVQHL